MTTLKIELGTDGKLWVTLTHSLDEDLARMKKIPGHRWHRARKQWSFPDTQESRTALAEFIVTPTSAAKHITVKSEKPDV